MTDWLNILTAQPFFAVGLTLLAYALADLLWVRTGRLPVLNPVLVASAVLAMCLIALRIPYETYLLQAQPINEALAAIVVLLAVPLCSQFPLIKEARTAMLLALIAGSAISIGCAVLPPLLSSANSAILPTIAPKSATTAVSVEISERLGGLPGVTAVIVIATGVFGAAFGPSLLSRAGVADHRALGFALGVASHAIGTARAFQISDTAGAFASLGMILNALATILLVPPLLGALM